ncbi:MAG: LLM class flavin-dependent oxidoreductase [Candidatus Rokubacteria bacterium]|nr:LLM class flavin-dependent oxidoreductase [Candidatus Rokubacteria bacterium]
MAGGRVGAYLLPRDDLGRAVALARAAEELGYESVWVTHGLGRDSFLVLAAYADATRRVGLGTGVVPIYPRHPVAMAQEGATLAELSGGRLQLGLGVSHRASMTDALGLDMRRPLEVMREYVAVLRGALTGRVRFEGRYYRVAWDAAFQPPAPPPPLLLAGLSTPMLELAGEVADGVVLWLCAPAYIRDVARPSLGRGRARAGKSLDGFEIVAAVPIALTEDVKGLTATFREELVRYLSLPFYRAMLRASGFAEALAAFDRDRGPRAPAEAVPAALTDALGAIGDRATVRAYVEAHRAAGVTLPVVRPIGAPEAPHARPTLEAAAS